MEIWHLRFTPCDNLERRAVAMEYRESSGIAVRGREALSWNRDGKPATSQTPAVGWRVAFSHPGMMATRESGHIEHTRNVTEICERGEFRVKDGLKLHPARFKLRGQRLQGDSQDPGLKTQATGDKTRVEWERGLKCSERH